MLGIPNQRILRSMSKYGIVDITVDFEDGTDIYWARQQVSNGCPTSGRPARGISGGMAPITTPLGEMFMFTVESKRCRWRKRRNLLDWVIRPPCVRCRAWRMSTRWAARCARSRSFPTQVKVPPSAVHHADARPRSRPTTATTAPAVCVKAMKCCWCAPKAACRTMDDLRAIVVKADGASVRVADVAQVRDGSVSRATAW